MTRFPGAFGSLLLVSFAFISFGFIDHRSPPVVVASLQSAQHLRCPAFDAIGTREACLVELVGSLRDLDAKLLAHRCC